MIDYTYIQTQTLDEALMQLFSLVTLLRSEDGCPWDREQDNKSIATSLLDETYEYLDAVLSNNKEEQKEEIGDVALNVMMLLEMHQEHEDFSIVDAINDVCKKLIRRHPHVFSTAKAEDSTQVLDLWNKIKVEVEGKSATEDDFFSRVPTSLPPMEMANEIQKKIRKVGFDWPDKQGVIDKVCEELDEVIEADTAIDRDQDEVEMEVGDLLFAVVNLARYLKVSPSVALHRSNMKMKRRFNALSTLCKERGITLDSAHLEEMDAIWDEVKEGEK
ncbi:nucleoside triphosphate pyrophosphohydrolase [Sphaerochaeta sp. PS]|uniref:nucleoside triphosphate pyrophosphohydrolase n=1 Tax=Sphaerochaeta sp. PS TaxID=3076336 RepID=UPI0028A2F9DE|nr:nucleoside triphosphate pyrophosphohydrolase [Sphaerochaeta sp. PS]MDT4761459.1 nucleoside triphosphate pyrophosphohydrolase [Sphaerochaeta sp. PS]